MKSAMRRCILLCKQLQGKVDTVMVTGTLANDVDYAYVKMALLLRNKMKLTLFYQDTII